LIFAGRDSTRAGKTGVPSSGLFRPCPRIATVRRSPLKGRALVRWCRFRSGLRPESNTAIPRSRRPTSRTPAGSWQPRMISDYRLAPTGECPTLFPWHLGFQTSRFP
jgi:hypothetical protein